MYAAETLTALSVRRGYTKCSLPLISSHLRAPTPICRSPPLFTIHALLFTCSERQADKAVLRLHFSPHPDRERGRLQTRRDPQTSRAGYQTPSSRWRIDYRCQRAHKSSVAFFFFFLKLCENLQCERILCCFPHQIKDCKWMKF